MRAGLLRHRLRIQAPDVQFTLDGSQQVEFRDVTRADGTPLIVWGMVESRNENEHLIALQDTARTLVRLTVRWMPNLPSTYQLVMEDGRIFEPTGVMDKDERHRTLTIWAIEKSVPSPVLLSMA